MCIEPANAGWHLETACKICLDYTHNTRTGELIAKERRISIRLQESTPTCRRQLIHGYSEDSSPFPISLSHLNTPPSQTNPHTNYDDGMLQPASSGTREGRAGDWYWSKFQPYCVFNPPPTLFAFNTSPRHRLHFF
jgi:hypothetical protein